VKGMDKYIEAFKILIEVDDKLDEVLYLFSRTLIDEIGYVEEAQRNVRMFIGTLLYWLYKDGKIKIDESE